MRSQSRNWATLGIALVVLLLLSAGVPGHAANATKASPDHPVDLNRASVEALTTIPGIGRVTAERIVEWRESNGPFRRIEDLMKVKGIGDKTFDKLRPYIKVGKSR